MRAPLAHTPAGPFVLKGHEMDYAQPVLTCATDMSLLVLEGNEVANCDECGCPIVISSAGPRMVAEEIGCDPEDVMCCCKSCMQALVAASDNPGVKGKTLSDAPLEEVAKIRGCTVEELEELQKQWEGTPVLEL